MAFASNEDMPVIPELMSFDTRGGNRLERMIFNFRGWVLTLCAIATVVFGWQAAGIGVNASFESMIPSNHPFVQNYMENQSELKGLGNTLRIVVEHTADDIFDRTYLGKLAEINDRLFLMPGVDRAWMMSLWTPVVRWTEVTEEGFSGGPVMPSDYDESAESILELRRNIERAGIVGSLVANDFKSTMIIVPLLDQAAEGEGALSYAELGYKLEEIRTGFEADGTLKIHIIGFAKLMSALIEGLYQVMAFFLAAAVIATSIIYVYTRCIRSTLLVVSCSLVAVVWQLGIVHWLGFELDPYSILVPFLIFAIGVSHGAQKMNGIMLDIARGTHKYIAARYTFRRLFITGLTALLADAVGFGVLMLVDIPVIHHLALSASVGVAGLILTNLILLPVLLSYAGSSPAAAQRAFVSQQSGKVLNHPIARFLCHFTQRRWAFSALGISAVLVVVGFAVSLHLQVGDLDPGAPELRADSRYNRDIAYVGEHFGLSSDVFAVIVKTVPDGCTDYDTMIKIDKLTALLGQTSGVQTSHSLADRVRLFTSGSFEGSPKWYTISSDQHLLNPAIAGEAAMATTMMNADCSVIPVIAYLKDHKAETLRRVTSVVEDFAAEHDTKDTRFLLAAGSAGIEAATNSVVKQANREMLAYVYSAVALLCFITFRSWRAVVVAIIPLIATSILCEALMVTLGIGIKVATLPVVALGVGIGIDYALYLLSVQLAYQRKGMSLREAYARSLEFTGKVVALVGVTLAAGVITWVWSPIKFQADMGALLAFMFLWNMIGALILIPALSCLLLTGKHSPAPRVLIHSDNSVSAEQKSHLVNLPASKAKAMLETREKKSKVNSLPETSELR